MEKSGDVEETLKCWRDPNLVRKLTKVRMRVVTRQLKTAKSRFQEEVRYVSRALTQAEASSALKDANDVRSTWASENPRLQKKVSHLVMKAGKCESHKVCREVDKLDKEKQKKSKDLRAAETEWIIKKSEETSGGGGGGLRNVTGDPENPGAAPPTKDPSSVLSSIYWSRPEDLQRLTKEKEELIRISSNRNKNWSASNPTETEVDNDDTEVIVYGSVELSQNERELLNLGPGFMVVSRLSEEELRVESSVTMTKIRWSRRKMGIEDLTEEQANK